MCISVKLSVKCKTSKKTLQTSKSFKKISLHTFPRELLEDVLYEYKGINQVKGTHHSRKRRDPTQQRNKGISGWWWREIVGQLFNWPSEQKDEGLQERVEMNRVSDIFNYIEREFSLLPGNPGMNSWEVYINKFNRWTNWMVINSRKSQV